MKKIIFIAILFGSVFTFSNCKKEETTTPPKPTSANITVSIRKLASETGSVNCNGLSVELHSNALYTAKVKGVISSGSATAATASFPSTANGKYYLIAWKDIDASSTYSAGDLFGFVETPVIISGVAKSYIIDVYILKD
ncbi:MAG: hypothetical protein ACOYO1_16450 [Bacteroidales bacterium]